MENKKEPKQVIIVRKDLNMRRGKQIAQGAHASMKVIFNMIEEEDIQIQSTPYIRKSLFIEKYSVLDKWINGCFKKVVVGAETLNELVTAYNQAKHVNIPCSIIEDKGLTEFGGKITITACAIGPATEEEIDKITKHLKLL